MTVRRGPRPTGDRLRRLLVMLPWLMERGEVPVAEMCHRFELSEQELVKDLELAAMCGLPPFVDEMVDVFIDEGVVFAGVPRLFTRPLALTAPEGFALLAAARVAMQLPGADADGALARALHKLAVALGDDAIDPARWRRHLREAVQFAVERFEKGVFGRSLPLPPPWPTLHNAARACTSATGRRQRIDEPSARSPRDGCSSKVATGT